RRPYARRRIRMIRRTVRSLVRAPVFTATGVVSIALGIGLLASFARFPATVSAGPQFANAHRLVAVLATASPVSSTTSDVRPAARLEAWLGSAFRLLEGLAGRGLGADSRCLRWRIPV